MVQKKLTIAPGAILKETVSGDTYGITINGELEAIGTAAKPILFTAYTDPAFGSQTLYYWNGISINSTANVILDYVNIRYAVSKGILNSGTLKLTNSKIEKGKGFGIQNASEGNDVCLENNIISENTSDGIYIYKMMCGDFTFKNNRIERGGKYSIEVALDYFEPHELVGGFEDNTIDGMIRLSGRTRTDITISKFQYELSQITIETGTTFTIKEGLFLRMSGGLVVKGTLFTTGTSAKPVVFTSTRDMKYDGGTTSYQWSGIQVTNIGSAILDYVTIRNSGKYSTNAFGNAVIEYPISCMGKLSLTNSSIEESEYNGLFFNTMFQPTLRNNKFSNIKYYAMQNANYSNITISAPEHQWNSNDGPTVEMAGYTTDGLKISRGIQYIPFISKNGAIGSHVHVQVSYPYDTVKLQNTTARISVQGSASQYYAEVYCSWDKTVWYKRGEGTIATNAAHTGFKDFDFPIYESGILYTKAILYEAKGGTQLLESEIIRNNVETWYYKFFKEKVLVKNYKSPFKWLLAERYMKMTKSGTTTTLSSIMKTEWDNTWGEYSFSSNRWVKGSREYYNNIAVKQPTGNGIKQMRAIPMELQDTQMILDTKKFTYDEEKDIYYALTDWNQTSVPADNLADNISQKDGMIVDWEPIEFTYGNKKYMLSMWKGQYYLCTGGEVGLCKEVNGCYQPTAATGLQIKCALKNAAQTIGEIESSTGWCTILKAGNYQNKNGLKLEVTMAFSDIEMMQVLLVALQEKKYAVTVKENTITFVMAKAAYQQPVMEAKPEGVWSAFLIEMVEQYKAFAMYTPKTRDTQNKTTPAFYKTVTDILFETLFKEEDPKRTIEEMIESPLKMDYNVNRDRPWVYCNYPEKLYSIDFLGFYPTLNKDFIETGKPEEAGAYLYERYTEDTGMICLNRVNVSAGEGEVFYSYQGGMPRNNESSYKIGIRVSTTGSESVMFKVLNYGHCDSNEGRTWTDVAFTTLEQFFGYDKQKQKVIFVDKEHPEWVALETVCDGYIFSGILKYYTDKAVTIEVYAFKEENQSSITGKELLYPYNYNVKDYPRSSYEPKAGDSPEVAARKGRVSSALHRYKMYSGKGEGYNLKANRHIIYVSELLKGKKVFYTNDRETPLDNFSVNYNPFATGTVIPLQEMIPIYIAGTSFKAEKGDRYDGPLRNLGNWAAHYYFPFTFINDTNRPSVRIKLTVRPGAHSPSKDVNGFYDFSKDPFHRFCFVRCKDTSGKELIYRLKIGQYLKGQDYGDEPKPWNCEFVISDNRSIVIDNNSKLGVNGMRMEDFDYQFILGTNSAGTVKHIIELDTK